MSRDQTYGAGWPEWLTTYDHIGSHYPFFQSGISPVTRSYSLHPKELLNTMPGGRPTLDSVAVVEMVSRTHLLSDRTLAQGLLRAPWMSRPTVDGWRRETIPAHGHAHASLDMVAAELYAQIQNELRAAAHRAQTVGILLSGGLDSRIVAGALRDLQASGDLPVRVVAFTWGARDTRDVEYARRIAARFEWDWVHLELTPEDFLANVQVAAEYGAEFSALHLHGMQKIGSTEGIDVVVAGSYGDSIGRAEFSGTRARMLRSIIPADLNTYGILRSAVIAQAASTVRSDALSTRDGSDFRDEWQYRELEQQQHYMRRKLQACMSVIGWRIPLYQAFTSPRAVGLMWGLDPDLRDDRVYGHILQRLPGGIGGMPWARTGKPLNGNGPADSLTKTNYLYARWLRRDLRADLERVILGSGLEATGLFNWGAVRRLVRMWPRASTVTINRIDETVAWLASLAVYIDLYDVKPPSIEEGGHVRDAFASISGSLEAWIYRSGRNWLRQ